MTSLVHFEYLGSGDPSLMAADKPCPQLQPSLFQTLLLGPTKTLLPALLSVRASVLSNTNHHTYVCYSVNHPYIHNGKKWSFDLIKVIKTNWISRDF